MVSSTNLTGSSAADRDTNKSFTEDVNKNRTDEEKSFPVRNGKISRPRPETKGSSLRQVTAAFIANLGTINTGLTMGFSAVANPQLTDKSAAFSISKEEASWVASLASIGTPCGCILSAYITDQLGRKPTLVLTELPAIVGWIIIALAPSVEWIYVGRILTGISSGMVGAPSRVYTAEVSQPHLRGILLALASVGCSLGVALEYIIGSLCTWKMLAFVSSSIPMLSLCTCYFLPESPSWLVSSGQKHKCFNSLKKLRDSTYDVQREVDTLVEFSERHNANAKMTAKQKLRYLCQAAVFKPFLILTTYFFIYQMSGHNPLTFYAVIIFGEFGADKRKYLLTVIIGFLRLIFTIIGGILMLRWRRRTLTFISTIGCGLSMILLSIYDFLMQHKLSEPMLWIPVSVIFVFIIVSTVGYLIVPWVMIGELYPVKVRGFVGGMTTALCHLFIFIAVKTYPLLNNCFTKSGVFLFYGMTSLLGTIFLNIYLPETKDKTLQEIEEHFSNIKSNKNTNRIKELKPIVTKNVNARNIV